MNSISLKEEKRIIGKVSKRILPFLIICYILAYLDRANIGYAALEMNADLGLSSKVFGFATGIFFIGYFLFEVPSNVLMERYGARKWIARILITWGLISACTGLAQNATQLYIIRFLLGIAEAGFYPGIILYLSYWFRAKERALSIAIFSMAVPISYIIGAPASTMIMDNVNWLDIAGWRWMFVIEGLPAALLGIIAFFYLTDKPKDAKWLSSNEKEWLINELEKERKSAGNQPHQSHLKALTNPKAVYLALIYFIYLTGSLGVGYWMPQIIKGFSTSLTNTQIGFIATIPYIVSTVVMILWSKNSDRMKERRLHSAIPLLVGGIALAGAGIMSESPVIAMICITLSLTGMYSFKGPFWTYPQLLIAPSAIAVSIAMINSLGNLGGFVGPYMMGILNDMFNSTEIGLYFLSALLLISFLMTIMLKEPDSQSAQQEKINDLSKEDKNVM